MMIENNEINDTMKKPGDLTYLSSVGTFIDLDNDCTYTALANGGVEDDETHIDDCASEWYEAMSEEDKEVIRTNYPEWAERAENGGWRV